MKTRVIVMAVSIVLEGLFLGCLYIVWRLLGHEHFSTVWSMVVALAVVITFSFIKTVARYYRAREVVKR